MPAGRPTEYKPEAFEDFVVRASNLDCVEIDTDGICLFTYGGGMLYCSTNVLYKLSQMKEFPELHHGP